MSDLIGRQLGDYKLLSLIGAGGMGQVYLAEQVVLRKKYALKVLPPGLARDRDFVNRFHDEARVMAELDHPHIVKVHYAGRVSVESDGRTGEVYFLAMDYVTGPDGQSESLHDRLKKQPDGRIPEADVRRWAIQIAEALQYAHDRGVVHRDLKPANILIDAQGNAKLTDFGLAKAIGSEFILSQIHQTMKTLNSVRTLRADLTAVGDTLDLGATLPEGGSDKRSSGASSLLGTYDYMAPEQRGEHGGVIDARTDIYAFGVVLYRLLTGKRPAGRAKAITDLLPSAAKEWDAFVDRCMEDAPSDRFPSASALLAAFGAPSLHPARRSGRLLAPVIGGVVVLLAIAAGWFAIQGMSRNVPQKPPAEISSQPSKDPPEVALKKVVPVQTHARQAREIVQKFDRGQGFGARLDAIETDWLNAEALFGKNAYTAAQDYYSKVQGACEVLQKVEAERQSALTARNEAQTARQAVEADQSEPHVAPAWANAESLAGQAARAFDDPNAFQSAQMNWQGATAAYKEARELADAARGVSSAKASYDSDATAYKQLLDDYGTGIESLLQARASAAKGQEAWLTKEEATDRESQFKKARTQLSQAVSAANGKQQAAKALEEKRQAQQRVNACIDEANQLARDAGFDPAQAPGTNSTPARIAAARAALEKLKPGQSEKLADTTKLRQVQQQLQAWANAAPAQTDQITLDCNGVPLKLKLIPAGTFTMGSPDSVQDRFPDEGPQHRVTISQPFYMGVTEVTQGQWQAVMGTNPSIFKGDPNLSVEQVSWDDCQEFCRKLSAKTGRSIRLPTEAEWEYACRAGTRTRYSAGDSDEDLQRSGWYEANSGSKTHAVGQKAPNAWGLYDMHGNVWEWCADWHGSYSGEPQTDPVGPSSGADRVLRGGSWNSPPWDCRSALRLRLTPGHRNYSLGFRVVSGTP